MENGFGYSYGGYGSYGRNESIPERSVVCVRATVMLFENEMKRWIASGPFAGLSRIQIYHQTYNNTFRINGIRMDSGEVSLDCDVTQSLVYNPATPIFHQWKQDGRIVGLHFNSENEAREFSRAIDSALETLNNPVNYNSTSNYRGYGSEPEVTTARPTYAASETTRTGAMTPTANSSPEVVETTTATTITPKARTPEATSATTASLAPATTAEPPPPEATPTTTTTATNFASYTPASITPPASSASKAAFESATDSSSSAAAAAAASDAAPKVTSPKFQTSCRFVPKAQTSTTANELSSSSSPPAYVTPTAAVSSPPPPATPGTPSYVGTTSSFPQASYYSKEQAELKDNERGGVNVFPVQPADVASVVENQSTADVASSIPPVATNQVEATAVPEGPPPFVPPPPPPPPPPPVCITAPCGDLGSALAGAQLRKARGDEESGGGTLSRSASPSLSDLQSDIMSEMARKLKERKARANATPSPVPAPTNNNASSSGTVSQLEPVTLQERRASFDRGHERRPSVDRCRSPIPSQPSSATSKPPAVNNNILDSPKFPRSKRIQSLTGQEGPPSVGSGAGAPPGGQGSYATSAELESVKQELMQFVRTEVTKAKQEIIDAVRLLLLRQQ